MSEETTQDPDSEDELANVGLIPARFPVEFGLPDADRKLLDDAAVAVRQEFRDCSKWKRLRCRKVSIFAERQRGTIYVVNVGCSVEFDWTWEGARAFRPKSLDDNGKFPDAAYEDADYEDEILWSGEILEVDERNGCLFVALDNPEARPTTGSFFVRPFEFLEGLDAVYNRAAFGRIRGILPQRLAAAEGGIHPTIARPLASGLSQLSEWWQHSWSVLWGPPGTGKTYTSGLQIAAVLADQDERILVVSTTNRATDAIALSIGNAAKKTAPQELDEGKVLRIGKGASPQVFANDGLETMLRGSESDVLLQIDDLAQQLEAFDGWEDKALTRKQMGELRAGSNDQSKRLFIDPLVRVIVATAFKAMSFLDDAIVKQLIENGDAPFTTILIDEAGLMSRAAIAALSLLAARRVVLVGDSKQLAPISRMSRILPTRQQTWLGSSGLSHLDDLDATPNAVHVLTEQRRMHPDVCQVVSDFQYGGHLKTAADTLQRNTGLSPFIADFSRAIWYVLDADCSELAAIRAERGPGNKSWVRSITPSILEKLFSDTSLRNAHGLFISPYKAQAQIVSNLFARWGLAHWEASTVHSQQGSEADIVIFDTVNAGSYNWPFDEWKRLVNVAISRAREAVIVLASRSEMEEPYLRPLLRRLIPARLIQDDSGCRWEIIDMARQLNRSDAKSEILSESSASYGTGAKTSGGMGQQFATRKVMKPVLSQEQQRLTNLKLDGKARLVRGVAGSGKSVVLCNWLARTVKRTEAEKNVTIWAVYANSSLHKLLRESIESAWENLSVGDLFARREFPWERVQLLHVRSVLSGILPAASLSMDSFDFDYDRAAEEFLNRQDATQLLPRCSALFIDEAQDMGPSTLKLLLSLVEQLDPDDEMSRSAHIFYDNAQNVYGRKTPIWSDLGVDLRGRSTIMRESFRSTTPVTELAVNVLHQFTKDAENPDQKELLSLGLIERCERSGREWLRVRYNQVNGPKPIFHCFDQRSEEIDRIAAHLKHLIQVDGISPNDICVIYNGRLAAQLMESNLRPKLDEIGVELSFQTSRSFERQPNTLVVTTSHSFKGYESEVVLIPCVDQFVTGEGEILANSLYVAMTRARSLLAIYGIHTGSSASRLLMETMADCIVVQNAVPNIDGSNSIQDDLIDIMKRIGTQHRPWLVNLWKSHQIHQEPILNDIGQIIVDPLFWFEHEGMKWACFENDSAGNDGIADSLTANRIRILRSGDLPCIR